MLFAYRNSRRISTAHRLRRLAPAGPAPHAKHIPQYRRLYAIVASWAEAQLRIPWNPEPLAYLHGRGVSQ